MAEEKKQQLQGQDLKDGEPIRRRRSRKTIGEEGGKKQVVAVFLVVMVLSLVFYLPTEVKQWWQRFNQPEVITIERPVGDTKDLSQVVGFKVNIREPEEGAAAVEKLLEGLVGDYGVYVKKLTGQDGFSIGGDKLLEAASVNKLPILAAYYSAVDEGEFDSEEIYTLAEKDRFEYGTGEMQNAVVGTKYSYREIAKLTANQSDNMGSQLLLKFLGGSRKVQVRVDDWGFKKTDINEVKTTAKEMGELLMRLYRDELISEESREELFDNLTDTVLEDRIPAGVPTGIRVVHKFGSEEGVVNDCGIVYANNPYVICVLSFGVNDGEAQGVLPKISRVVWEWGILTP